MRIATLLFQLFVVLCLLGSGLARPVYAVGEVFAWGANHPGQLGDGTTTDRSTPVQVTDLSGVIAIANGSQHSVALKNDGTVWTWGRNNEGQLGIGIPGNYYENYRSTPVQVSGLSDVTAIDAGTFSTIALKRDRSVWSWGTTSYGQSGDGTTTDRNTPTQISALSDIVAVSAGYTHMVALERNGSVWAWGSNDSGELGDGTTTNRAFPVLVSGLSDVTFIVAGTSHTVAIKSDGSVWAWGFNSYGQLGDGTTTDRLIPVQVSGLSNVTAVSASTHTVALKSDGSVWTWGRNINGQLGDGTTIDRSTPVLVSGLSNVTLIGSGSNHTAALKSDGTAWSWGSNFVGQLGDGGYGNSANRSIPVQVNGIGSGTVIATGSNHTTVVVTYPVYCISGRIVNHEGTGIPNVLVRRSTGTYSTSIYTDNNGNYRFPNVRSGSYTIAPVLTPAMAGMSFSPASRAITVDRSNVQVHNFTATFSINGRIANNSGVGISGVLVQRTAGTSTISIYTDANGNFQFSNVRSGSYTIAPALTPPKAGMSFSPTSRSVTVDKINMLSQNFVGLFSIGGRITTSAGAAKAGVVVRLNSGSTTITSTTTDANGNYRFSNVRSGNYSVEPQGSGFSPVTRELTVGMLNIMYQNFIDSN